MVHLHAPHPYPPLMHLPNFPKIEIFDFFDFFVDDCKAKCMQVKSESYNLLICINNLLINVCILTFGSSSSSPAHLLTSV